MTSYVFNKIDNTYFLLEEKSKDFCNQNNVDFYEYLSIFKRLLKSYSLDKIKIKAIEGLNFNDYIKARTILNKSTISSKEYELSVINTQFNKSRIDLFEWLDNTHDPYFFILNPIYKFGAGIDYNSHIKKGYGYIKETCTGINNIDIACDYALYKSI